MQAFVKHQDFSGFSCRLQISLKKLALSMALEGLTTIYERAKLG
jgi:hypothetical protein